jgi:hypothetical protein
MDYAPITRAETIEMISKIRNGTQNRFEERRKEILSRPEVREVIEQNKLYREEYERKKAEGIKVGLKDLPGFRLVRGLMEVLDDPVELEIALGIDPHKSYNPIGRMPSHYIPWDC